MKTYKQYLAETEAKKAPPEKYVFVHFDENDYEAELVAYRLLGEAKKEVDLGKGRKIYFHKAHIPNTEDHLHFYVKGSKAFALNQSGTAHDRSHGVQMANWAVDAVKKHYPQFTIPKKGLIEHLLADQSGGMLCESDGKQRILVSKSEMITAITVAVQY